MGTLASELGSHAERLSDQPRVYVDANVPAGLVAFMRRTLGWDALFVIEHDDLRRARDGEHFRLARQLRRTLITLDNDYLDDRAFPPGESGGVLVLTAPSPRAYEALLRRIDRELLRAVPSAAIQDPRLPLAGRTLRVHADWRGPSPSSRTPTSR
jgi:predicted nuclease of predicted toxin-antitoxin system